MPHGAKQGKKRGKKSQKTDASAFAKEIAAAVDMLPERVMAEYTPTGETLPKNTSRMMVGHVERENRRLLFLGVGGLLIILVVMWGWNARAFIGDVFSSSKGISLFPKTKQSISSMFKTISQTAVLPAETASTTHETEADTALKGSFASLFTSSTTSTANTASSTLATTSTAVVR